MTRHWPADLAGSGPRRARMGGTFRAFIPHPLGGRALALDARVAADVADAERQLLMLDGEVAAQPSPHRLEVLARLLLRAEAVGSSRIEGLVVSPRRLAVAQFDRAGAAPHVHDVVGNIEALQEALVVAEVGRDLGVADLCHLHRTLLAPTRDAALGGHVRTEQNWIGGPSPLHAAFVPPPPEALPPLLADLCRYLSGTDHSPLVQAALVHAQFETLHPFADGNGRTGRALIHLVLRRRGVCRRFVPPISLVLATWSNRYVEGLMGTRTASPPSAPAEQEGAQRWIELLAHATHEACREANAYDTAVDGLVTAWRARLSETSPAPRADAAVWALLPWLPAAPLLTAATATEFTGRSPRAIDAALVLLLQAGVIKQVGGKTRHRLYEAVGVFDLVTRAERAPVGTR